MQKKLLEKAQRRLSLNSEYTPDNDLINDFIENAVYEIKSWRKLSNDTEFLDGRYDMVIVNFVVESYNTIGIEGQTYNSDGASARQFNGTPLSHLRSSVKQGL